MKQTKTSKSIMNTLIRTLTAVIDVPAIALIPNMINIMQVNDSAIECPAIILAKSRIINANGLVKMLKNSINGINGTGTFNHIGTSGQNMSFQYALVPVIFVIKKVHKAKKKVIVIFPVRLPPPGGNGTTPHNVGNENEKETGQKIRCILISLFP